MRGFKHLYAVVSYSLLTAQIGFLSIFLYNKLMYDREPDYGGDRPIDLISENYFFVLKILLYATFVLLITWALLTPLAVLANKRAVADDGRIHMTKGIAGFVLAVVLLITDPFGILKWFSK